MSVAAAEVQITGQVQGVGFRWYTTQRADSHAVTGWVRNNADGSVTVYAEGGRGAIESFLSELRSGPSSARVTDMDIDWREYTGNYNGFGIKH